MGFSIRVRYKPTDIELEGCVLLGKGVAMRPKDIKMRWGLNARNPDFDGNVKRLRKLYASLCRAMGGRKGLHTGTAPLLALLAINVFWGGSSPPG